MQHSTSKKIANNLDSDLSIDLTSISEGIDEILISILKFKIFGLFSSPKKALITQLYIISGNIL